MTPVVSETGWMEWAECKGADQTTFYPLPVGNEARRESAGRYAAALRICEQCPVQVTCLEHALFFGEREGMWGGKTPRQRQTIRTRRNR